MPTTPTVKASVARRYATATELLHNAEVRLNNAREKFDEAEKDCQRARAELADIKAQLQNLLEES